MGTPVLSVTDVNTFYGSIHALRGISLDVEQGEIVALIGGNGAGKSTTLNTISGIVPLRSGQVTLNGEDLGKFKAHQITEKGVVQGRVCRESKRGMGSQFLRRFCHNRRKNRRVLSDVYTK